MARMDPRLSCLCNAAPEHQDRLARTEGYIGCTEATGDGTGTGPKVQVIIQLVNPCRQVDVPDLRIRSRIADMATAEVPLSALAALADHPNVAYVERGSRVTVENVLTSAPAATSIPQKQLDCTGRGVIVGIIDHGCDFSHPAFRNVKVSRILHYWDQTAAAIDWEPSPLHPPGENLPGVEFSNERLSGALREDGNPFNNAFVRPPSPGAHGTHVMGIATGVDPSQPSAPSGLAHGADIIFVQLRTGDYDEQGGFGDTTNLIDAMKYIFDKADHLGRPAVINVSLNTNSGPHDGTSLAERCIDRLAEQPGHAVVLAMGNEHDQHNNRTHAEGCLDTGGSTTLYWRVNPHDRTANEMEIWYSGRDRLAVSLTMPGARTDQLCALDGVSVRPGETRSFDVGDGGTQVHIASTVHSPLNGDNQISIIMYHREDAPLEDGVWQVTLTALEARDGGFDAWIDRDYRSNTSVPQSNFVAGSYSRRKTLGSIQSAHEAITVSSYNAATGNLADSNSYGPTRDGRAAPVIAAPGVAVWAANAYYQQHIGDTPAPAYVQKSGTSMAAAHVTGLVACMFEKNPRLTGRQIRALLADNAKPALGLDQSHRVDWGYGRVDPAATLLAAPIDNQHRRRTRQPHRRTPTLSHALGPEYRANAPRPPRDQSMPNIYPPDGNRDVLHFFGRVVNVNDQPVAGAQVELWHGYPHDNRDYSNGDPDDPRGFYCRAILETDENGSFAVTTQLPHNYSPIDDPENWMRVKHMHFLISAPAHEDLATEVTLLPDEHETRDPWRMNRESLKTVMDKIETQTEDGKDQWQASFEFVLNRAVAAGIE